MFVLVNLVEKFFLARSFLAETLVRASLTGLHRGSFGEELESERNETQNGDNKQFDHLDVFLSRRNG